MKILFYSAGHFEKHWFTEACKCPYRIRFERSLLDASTAAKAKGYEIISIGPADDASSPVIEQLKQGGVRFIALRASGADNVDLRAAASHSIQVSNVPEYSPYSVAEHAVALMLALNRQLVHAHEHMRQHDYQLDQLVGFDLHRKTVGVIGTGRTGSILAKIMHGFGCEVLAYDINPDRGLTEKYDVQYVPLQTLCSASDIISIHVPYGINTKHMISAPLIETMKRGVMIINIAHGGIVNTADVVKYLENGHIGYFGMDGYEREREQFYHIARRKRPGDPLLEKLLAFDNVLVTPHQAFATKEALLNIAATTLMNIDSWVNHVRSGHELNGRP
ncbi:MAG TPA: 2-hydroxyacid dehydrogenase, partial [Flavisolibacter sp.]